MNVNELKTKMLELVHEFESSQDAELDSLCIYTDVTDIGISRQIKYNFEMKVR